MTRTEAILDTSRHRCAVYRTGDDKYYAMFFGPNVDTVDGYVFVVESQGSAGAKAVNGELIQLAKAESANRGITHVDQIHDEPRRDMPIDPPIPVTNS